MAKEEQTDIERMLSGNFDVSEIAQEETTEEVTEETNADNTEENVISQDEDTDQQDDTEDDTDTNEEPAEELEDTEDSDEEDEEEHTPEGEDSSEEDDTTEEDDSDVTEDLEEASDEDETENTEEGDVPETVETDEIDYKKYFEDITKTEFVVNGKKTTGFTDPKKIIQAIQMAGGFSEKMAGFKQYRPYMGPLKERGMLDDPDKFNLAMDIIDGNPEAIKKHLASLNLDPLDFEMEDIKYNTPISQLASEQQIVVEDSMDRAKTLGVDQKLQTILSKDWDQASFNEFLSNGAVRADLMEHLSSGAYDVVQDKIHQMKSLDVDGTFSSMNSVEQYRQANSELAAEYEANKRKEVSKTPKVKAKPAVEDSKVEKIKAEKAKITKARKEAEYKAKIKAKESKVASKRSKATQTSKKRASAPAKKFDPMDSSSEEFINYFDSLIN